MHHAAPVLPAGPPWWPDASISSISRMSHCMFVCPQAQPCALRVQGVAESLGRAQHGLGALPHPLLRAGGLHWGHGRQPDPHAEEPHPAVGGQAGRCGAVPPGENSALSGQEAICCSSCLCSVGHATAAQGVSSAWRVRRPCRSWADACAVRCCCLTHGAAEPVTALGA